MECAQKCPAAVAIEGGSEKKEGRVGEQAERKTQSREQAIFYTTDSPSSKPEIAVCEGLKFFSGYKI
ncbi:hypothetical protein E2C01_069315 [Portunus trituberculatus]|uniref:Uncharacterized protein n=1 Tax=Portunus trituberculatus TaxID=210409 RepID=A0A5B7HYK6_PORTR|nr:hypothetical protein [Portunus trituberculatus]